MLGAARRSGAQAPVFRNNIVWNVLRQSLTAVTHLITNSCCLDISQNIYETRNLIMQVIYAGLTAFKFDPTQGD
ncbi:hypothetical protein BLA13014_05585 [Burkholderia aenigmatica]|uniref:Uncharacterized protein n=1 Tax=Burkholderia aenigmatica TaxID=2015348 RepID=A0A6P2QES1_9BURK|nr:hypothetical protein BLA13014_05585 [Burkholderia aenigmatica]